MRTQSFYAVITLIVIFSCFQNLFSAEKHWEKIDLYSKESGHTVYSRLYDNKARITQFDIERIISENNYSIERYVYEYDSRDSVSEIIRMRLQGGDIVPYYKSIYEYYDNGPRRKYESWYWTGSDYIIMNSAEWEYNEDFLVTYYLTEMFQADTAYEQIRIKREYDDNSNITMESSERKHDGVWIMYYRYSYKFENGLKVFEQKENKDDGELRIAYKGEWEYDERSLLKTKNFRSFKKGIQDYYEESLYQYNEEGKIIEEIYRNTDPDSQELIFRAKTEHEYQDGGKTIETKYSYIDNEWFAETRKTSIHDNNANLVERITEKRDEENILRVFYKLSNTYDNENRLIENFHYTFKNEEWVPDHKFYYNFDENGNKILASAERFENGEMYSSDLVEYTYNNGLLTQLNYTFQYEDNEPVVERKILSYDDSYLVEEVHEQKFGENWRDVEWDFEYKTKGIFFDDGYKLQIEWQEITSADEDDNVDMPFVIYPQPSSGIINLNYLAGSTGAVSVRVIDMSGNVVFKQSKVNTATLYKFDLSGLANGVYIFEITDGGVIRSREIVIAR